MTNQNKVLTTNENGKIRDYLLALDDLQQPKVLNMDKIVSGEFNTAIICIIRLILMRKGTDPDRPDMGIDIVGRYRFAFDSELISLQREIEDQITTYLPEFLPATVEISMATERNNPMYYNRIDIKIAVNTTMYQLFYNKESQELEVFAK